MSDWADEKGRRHERLSRRGWLLGSILGGVGVASWAWEGQLAAAVEEEDVPADLEPIFARAKAAKLRDFTFNESKEKHFVGIGDAPADYRDTALKICELLYEVYRDYFETKDFQVESPEHRLIVVVLKDKTSYKAYVGGPVGAEVGGHYDVEENQLVVFDSRGNQNGLAASARVNTFTLVHEALHQLTYNTGLLDRRGDVPAAISEGLATFGELWQHTNRRSTLGVKNSARLDVFTQSDGLAAWIPVKELLTNDDLFAAPETSQVAYAESWILVHYFIRTPSKRPKFRAYLEAIRSRREPAHRIEDAQTHLGDLDRLDKELRLYRNKQLRP